eukprot:TRINITY_DN1134_c0_g1_i2.p2 TRINITY_DN1134_c0_g1~~TRINITY_DN1134_c0_g1_i2.p2  ORF type:complete len:562 (-),score=99.73 TRINITY_DN1134_c0_g1_i2:3953-5638(-)
MLHKLTADKNLINRNKATIKNMTDRPQMRPRTAKPSGKKEHLERLLKNEKHRALLIKKFKAKYGTAPKISDIINNLVTAYIKRTPHITEESLAKLDSEIDHVLHFKPSEKPKLVPSIKKPPKTTVELDLEVDSRREPEPVAKPEEEKEWAAILKFNTELHKEEQKREKEKHQKQKEQVKSMLQKQMEEKQQIAAQERLETEQYVKLRNEHIQQMERAEIEREEKKKHKKEQEKRMLESALEAEREKKRQAELQEKLNDKEFLNKITQELSEDARVELTKRKIKNEHMRKLIEENEQNRKLQQELKKKEREADAKLLEEYAKVQEKQEQDRIEEVKKREKRTQQLMVHMADTVVKDLERKRREDELNMLKSQQEKDRRDQLDEELRLHRIREQQKELKSKLEQQMNDKKIKTEQEKEENRKQAEIWRKDLEAIAKEEQEIIEKTKEANKQYQEYLKKQMQDKRLPKKDVMTKEEFLMNKKLISQIEHHGIHQQFISYRNLHIIFNHKQSKGNIIEAYLCLLLACFQLYLLFLQQELHQNRSRSLLPCPPSQCTSQIAPQDPA